MRFQCFPARLHATRLLGATVATIGVAGAASAQPVAYPGVTASPGVQMVVGPGCAATNQGSYGPAAFAPNPKAHFALNGCEPYCVGRSSYPLSDWAYIRRFCGPTLIPGSCYGHFETKWRKWEDHCPGAAPCTAPAAAPCAPPCAPTLPAPPVATPVVPAAPPDVKTTPGGTTSVPPVLSLPPMEVPPVPVDPPKLPPIPKSVEAVILKPKTISTVIPKPKSVEAVVPKPMPPVTPKTEAIPVSLPPVVSPKESVKVSGETPVPPPPPGEPDRVVVPPLPEVPARK